jgi:hypothetical protein
MNANLDQSQQLVLIIFLRKAMNKMIINFDKSTEDDSEAMQQQALERISTETNFIQMTSFVLSLQNQGPESEHFQGECLWIAANLCLCAQAVKLIVEPQRNFLAHLKILLRSPNPHVRE